MNTVMILGAGPLQLPAIKKIKSMGYKVIACDYDPNAVGFKEVDVPLLVSTLDMEAVLEQARVYNPDYIITSTSDAPVKTVAYVCEKLGKPVELSYANAICATEKNAMRQRLKAYDVPVPKFHICTTYEEFDRALSNFDDLCVVKPADNAASRGVRLFSSKCEETEKMAQYEYSKGYSRNGIILVEEYMTGPEVSVEGVIENEKLTIITITDKLVCDKPYFVELGHSEPSQLSEATQNELKKIVANAVEAIGIVNGVCHAELKVTNDGPKIVEIAARLGGDYITSRLVPLSTGVDMVGASVDVALHRPTDISKQYNRGSAIRFIRGKSGVVKSISIPDDIKQKDGIEEICFYVEIGDRVNDLHSSNDRLGHVIASGATAQEAIQKAEQVINMIKINIE